MANAQNADETLKHVRLLVKNNEIPTSKGLHGLPRLEWQLYSQLGNLHTSSDVLCRKFYPRDSHPPYLEQIVPPSLVSEVITSLLDSLTSGSLGIFKSIEKIRERCYLRGFKDDVKLHVQQCDKSKQRANPTKTHRNSFVDWRVSYPFHHISINFLGGHLSLSNGNSHIHLIVDYFTK